MKRLLYIIIFSIIQIQVWSQTLPNSKYLKQGYALLEVKNYSGAAAIFENLMKFKKDKPYAISGLVWCSYKTMNKERLEKLLTQIEKDDPLQWFVKGVLQEYRGERAEALSNYEKYVSLETRKINAPIIQSARLGMKRLGEKPEDDEVRIQGMKLTTSNLVLEDYYMGGSWLNNALYFHASKVVPAGGKIQKIEGYMGSLSNQSEVSVITPLYVGGISAANDGKTVYVSKNEYDQGFCTVSEKTFKRLGVSTSGLNNLQLYVGKTNAQLSSIEIIDKLSFCQSEYNYIHPVVFSGGNKMIFSSDMAGSLGGYDLYVVEKTSNGTWGSPKNLGAGINTEGDEKYPYVYQDSLLYYSSNGKPGYGNMDVFVSVLFRGEFQEGLNMGKTINSGGDDIGMIQINKRQGMLFSNRDKMNKDQLFYFEYPIKYRKLKGKTKDKLYDQPLSDVLIEIYDKDSLIGKVSSNEAGMFSYNYLLEDKEYLVKASKPGFKPVEKIVKPGTTEVLLDWNDILSLEPIIEKKTVFRFNNILFDYGKANLKDSSKVILDRLAEVLLNNPNIKVELSAHTDTRSSHQFNMKLSQARAESCVRYLVAKGIKEQNIVARGYGKTRLLNHCKDGVPCSEEEHLVNRRVEIKVLDIASN
jgi:outer membrane protein OmpA-like peptidoglycan-associated protein